MEKCSRLRGRAFKEGERYQAPTPLLSSSTTTYYCASLLHAALNIGLLGIHHQYIHTLSQYRSVVLTQMGLEILGVPDMFLKSYSCCTGFICSVFNLQALVWYTLFSIVPYSIYLERLGGPELPWPLGVSRTIAPYMVPNRPYIRLHHCHQHQHYCPLYGTQQTLYSNTPLSSTSA